MVKGYKRRWTRYLGDLTAWYVFNDGVPAANRIFNDVNPLGIEIHQTIFGFASPESLSNFLFIRYKIINKNPNGKQLDSVYFSLWYDSDIGNPEDDLVGSDVSAAASGYDKQPTEGRNAVFTYNDGHDDFYLYGNMPPAYLVRLLQSPFIYTETQSDNATNFRGPYLGFNALSGYRQSGISSILQYYNSIYSNQSEPNSRLELRNYILGYNKNGSRIDPCNSEYRIVTGGVNCTQINNKFIFSGDPVRNIGWFQSTISDQRMMLTAGPFKLRANSDTAIVIAAMLFAQDSSALMSLEKAKVISDSAQLIYNRNFKLPGQITFPPNPLNFELEQNFPNPFNAKTKIKFTVPEKSLVTLKIFDALGREIATLLNEEKERRTYTIIFDAENLTSGIYFYKLQAGKYSEVKKMVLIK